MNRNCQCYMVRVKGGGHISSVGLLVLKVGWPILVKWPLSHFQEMNESSEASEVISATDLENTIEEDFEETNNVCSAAKT